MWDKSTIRHQNTKVKLVTNNVAIEADRAAIAAVTNNVANYENNAHRQEDPITDDDETPPLFGRTVEADALTCESFPNVQTLANIHQTRYRDTYPELELTQVHATYNDDDDDDFYYTSTGASDDNEEGEEEEDDDDDDDDGDSDPSDEGNIRHGPDDEDLREFKL